MPFTPPEPSVHTDMARSDVDLPRSFITRVERSPLPPAIVIGTGQTGLSIAHALHRHGVPVLGLDDRRGGCTSYSRAFHFLAYERLYEPVVVDLLLDIAELLPRKAALFCSGDEHVLILSRHQNRLAGRFLFELPAHQDVERLMSKQAFARVAEQHGWPVPRTFNVDTAAELDAALEAMAFPAILKPRVKNRQVRMHAPQKAFICETPQELRDRYRTLAQWEPEAVVQQWIPGGDDEIYFSFHYFDATLRELANFEGRKLRQYLPECGSTSCAVGVPEPRVTELSRTILTTMRSVGFCSVEYKRDPRNGKFYIIEPTVGRVNLQVGVALANQVDIIGRAYFHLIGKTPPVDGPATHHVKWILVPQDLRSARFYVRRGELTWRAYFRSIAGPRVFAPLQPADPPLWLAFGREWARRAVGAIGRRLMRRRRPERPRATAQESA